MRLLVVTFLWIFACAFGLSQKLLPDFRIDSTRGYGDFFGQLEGYLQNEIGIIDTTQTSNGIEGESYQATTTFRLKGGHTYTIYSEWESSSTVFEFKRIRKEEVINLLLNIFIQVNMYKTEMDSSLRTTGSYYIDLDPECCYFKVEERNKSTLLSIGY